MSEVEYTCICGRCLTKREAAAIRRKSKESEKDAKQLRLTNFSSKNSLVSDKIFTKDQIAILIEKGILTPLIEDGKTYFLRSQVIKGVRYLNQIGLFYD